MMGGFSCVGGSLAGVSEPSRVKRAHAMRWDSDAMGISYTQDD